MGDAAVYDLAAVVAERDALKAEVAQADAEYQDAITLAQSNKDRLDVALAEVARLSAACAAKDAALRSARELLHSSEWPSLCNNIDTALSDTAGTNWIDATGAVKAKVLRQTAFGNAWLEWTPMPADWAGAPVLIIPKPKE